MAVWVDPDNPGGVGTEADPYQFLSDVQAGEAGADLTINLVRAKTHPITAAHFEPQNTGWTVRSALGAGARATIQCSTNYIFNPTAGAGGVAGFVVRDVAIAGDPLNNPAHLILLRQTATNQVLDCAVDLTDIGAGPGIATDHLAAGAGLVLSRNTITNTPGGIYGLNVAGGPTNVTITNNHISGANGSFLLYIGHWNFDSALTLSGMYGNTFVVGGVTGNALLTRRLTQAISTGQLGSQHVNDCRGGAASIAIIDCRAGVTLVNALATGGVLGVYNNSSADTHLSFCQLAGSPAAIDSDDDQDPAKDSTGLEIHDSVLYSPGGYCISLGDAQQTYTAGDRNLFAYEGPNLGYYQVGATATLADWRTASGQDAHSFERTVADPSAFNDMSDGAWQLTLDNAALGQALNGADPGRGRCHVATLEGAWY